jgi:amyotrophic lateral sclerosis 2 protein
LSNVCPYSREQKADQEYWSRLLRWNRHPDLTLLTFFEVDFSLWELGGLERRGRDQLFAPAIHTLQQLKTTFSPQDKLEVVVQTFRAITAQAETANQTWSMDALLPVGQSQNKKEI